jgi:hypothetical protein
MRIGKTLAWTIAGAVVALLIASFVSSRSERQPPAVSLVSVEPAGIFDDAGEMLLVTLCITNPEPRCSGPIFVKESDEHFEAKIDSRWINANGGGVNLALYWQQRHETQLLVSWNGRALSSELEMACPRVMRGRLTWIAEQLPRFKFSIELWRWAVGYGGYPQYGPSTRWQNITVEFPLEKTRLVANAPETPKQ